MVFLGASEPFPTRMVVVRLANGDRFLWSPTEPDEGLRKEIDALGAVRHLVSPNKLHYVHVCASGSGHSPRPRRGPRWG
jgi:hypothetical protein